MEGIDWSMAEVQNASKRGEFSEQPDEEEMYDSMQSETVPGAINNLVENSLAGGVQNGVEEMSVEVFVTDEWIIVADNGGGVPDSNPKDVFKYGSSGSDESSASAFSFGVGAPSARNLLASQMSVFTQYQGESSVGFSESVVGSGWDSVELLSVPSWSDVDERVRETVSFELSDGVTVLLFENSNRDVVGQVDEIRSGIQDTFHRFLDASYDDTIDATVRVNGSVVESISEPSRVQSIVGLEPRRWMGIDLSGADAAPVEPPISCEIEVSLLEEDDNEFSGMWVYCNDLCLKAGSVDVDSGFGRGEQFGKNSGVMVVIDLYSCKNPQSLPWNQQKSDVSVTPILKEAYDWVERVGRAYFRASRKSRLQHLVRAFEADDVIETVEHTGRSTVHPRANIKASEVSEALEQVREIIEAHARLLVFSPEQVREVVDIPNGVSKREFGDMYEAFVLSFAESSNVGYWNTSDGEELDVKRDKFEYVDSVPPFAIEARKVIGEVVHHRGLVDDLNDVSMQTSQWNNSLYEYYSSKYSSVSNMFQKDEVIQSVDGKRCLVHSYFIVSCHQEVGIEDAGYEWCLTRLLRSPKVRWKIDSECVSLSDCIEVPSVDINSEEVRSENSPIVKDAYKDSQKPQIRDIDGEVYKQHLYEVTLGALIDGEVSSLPTKLEVEERQSKTTQTPDVSHGLDNSPNKSSSSELSNWNGASPHLLRQLSRLLNTVSKTPFASSQGAYNDNNVGRTLEDALCIPENNRQGADFLGDEDFTDELGEQGVELKAIRDGKMSNNITLMSMEPTEKIVWNELAAERYGTPSDINGSISVNAPLKYGKYNNENLRLMIDSDDEIIIEHKEDGFIASYDVDAVVDKMVRKLNDTVLVLAKSIQSESEWFHYHHATLYRGIDVDGLLDVVRSGEIVLEPRLEGAGKVKNHHNHGLRWRTTVSEIPTLYDKQ